MKQNPTPTKITCKLPKIDEITNSLPVNLRESSEGLEPVGNCATLASGVAEIHPLQADEYLSVAPNQRTISVTSGSATYSCGTLPAPLVGVCPAGTLGFWLFTESGPLMLARDSSGSYSLRADVPTFKAVRMYGARMNRFGATVFPERLSGEYTRGTGELEKADLEKIGSEMIRAWRSMQKRAANAGARIQPSLMAWRILDDMGQVLFCSQPQWLGLPVGMQLTESLSTLVKSSGDNFCLPDPFSFFADAWQPALMIDATEVDPFWAKNCAVLEVIAAPEPDFVDNSDVMEGRMDRDSSGYGKLTLFMPGASSGSSTDSAKMKSLMKTSLENFYSSATVVASLPRPFVQSQTAILPVSQAGKPIPEPVLPPEFSFPNRFAAGACLVSGTAIVLGNISPVDAPTWFPSDMAADFDVSDEEFTESVTVTRADGSVHSASRSGSRIKPTLLPAIIVCPDPDAVKLTLCAEGEAMTFELTRALCGRFSYWMSPDSRPVEWNPTSDSSELANLTDSSPVHKSRSGMIVSANAFAPLNPIAAHDISMGTIHRITPSVGSSGGWTYSLQHLMAWATDGIYSVSIKADLTSINACRLHSPGVDRPDAVALTPECIYSALSSGTLLRFVGAKVSTVDIRRKVEAVGWNQAERELWLASDGGVPIIITASGKVYQRTPLRVSRFCGSDAGVLRLIDSGGTLLNASDEMRPELVNVFWSASLRRQLPHSFQVRWDLDAEQTELNLSIMASNGGDPVTVCSHTLCNQINAPFTAQCYSPARELHTFQVTGTLTAPATLRTISLT